MAANRGLLFAIWLAAATFGAAAVAAAALATYAWTFQDASASDALGGFLLMLPFALTAMILIGLPLFVLALRFDKLTWRFASISGLSAGLLVAVILRTGNLVITEAIALAFVGLLSSLTFLVIWRNFSKA